MTRRTWIIMTTVATLLIGSNSVTMAEETKQAGVKRYTDMTSTHWAMESINDLSARNILSGYGDHTFQPWKTVTYGEFIKMMVVAITGQDCPVAEKPHHWALHYYEKGLEEKLYSANDISSQMLDRTIPRNVMALLLSNGLGSQQVENYKAIEQSVKDVNHTVKYDYHIIKAYGAGILNGYPGGEFKPNGTLNRGESAVVLQRFIDPSKRTPGKEAHPTNNVQIIEGSAINRGTELCEILRLSPSTKPIGEAVTNWMEYPKIVGNGVKYYEIMPDYPEKMDIVLGKFGGSEYIRMPYGNSGRAAALIKDGKCIADMTDYGDGDRSYYVWNRQLGHKLPGFDYIGFYNSGGDTMILVPNPFKNGYTIAEQL